MQTTLNPQDLAKKTTDEIMNNLDTENDADSILNSLRSHYEVLNKTQELQIEFLSEFVKNIKHLHKKDKDSLDFLKQRVLTHVLKNKSNI